MFDITWERLGAVAQPMSSDEVVSEASPVGLRAHQFFSSSVAYEGRPTVVLSGVFGISKTRGGTFAICCQMTINIPGTHSDTDRALAFLVGEIFASYRDVTGIEFICSEFWAHVFERICEGPDTLQPLSNGQVSVLIPRTMVEE